jgi:glycosyltransferase involved in cell wall biosynthesis
MRNMLIIHPHWPPSNLVGVHRVRLIANELHHLGWHAIVLTIDEQDYEEQLSPETLKLVHESVEVIRVRASPVRTLFGKRLVGDISLRGWSALKVAAESLLKARSIDFIWFSLPPWYTSLLGRILYKKFGVPFGIDYRDPWVYERAEHQKGFNRALATAIAARALEPRALKNVSLISGVSSGYLAGLLQRYPKVRSIPKVTFQMGFSPQDHNIDVPGFHAPFNMGKQTFVYAGAHWALGAPVFTLWLEALAELHHQSPIHEVEFLFVGTGNPELPSIQSQAKNLGIESLVREIPERQSYLEVQQMLRESDGALVLGSIEPHYSASKLFQCLITAPRLFGFFHTASEGREVLEICNADTFYVSYNPEKSKAQLSSELKSTIQRFIDPNSTWQPDFTPLAEYTSANNAKKFVAAVEQVIFSNDK